LEGLKYTGRIDNEQYAQGNKELATANKAIAAHRAIDEITSDLAQQQTGVNRFSNPIQAPQRIAALRARLIPLIQSVSETKRLNPETLGAEIDPLIQKFTSNKQTAQMFAHGLHGLITTHTDDTPTLNGLSNFGVQVPQYQPPAQTKTVNGVTYVRGPKGEAIPVRR
jgi:hypothetical protein